MLALKVDRTLQHHDDEFMRMCAWMKLCGSIGHYTDFRVSCDGDGPAHLKFNFLGPDQIKYERIKKDLLDEYDHQNKEPKVFQFD